VDNVNDVTSMMTAHYMLSQEDPAVVLRSKR